MTAMSSRRSFETVGAHSKTSTTGLSIAAFLVGLILLVAGIRFDAAVLAVIGFVPFTATLLYWNARFWAKRIDEKAMRQSYKYYPY